MTDLQTTWGWLVALDLFCGGLAAGVFCTIAVVALATGERFKSTIRFGAWASALPVALGALTLLLDVGRPFRALVMFKSFVHLDSWMTRGAWLMFSAILVNGLLALFWTDAVLARLERLWKPLNEKRAVWRLILMIVGIPINLGVAIYTGLLLGVLQFRPLWHTGLLPVLFVASALYTGLGLVTGYAAIRERGEGARRLRVALWAALLVLIVAVGVVLGVYLSDRLAGSPDMARSAQMLAGGPLGLVFWIVVVSLGLGVPLLAAIAQLSGILKRSPSAMRAVPVIAVVACLIGGWTLRFVVLSAGLPVTLSSPAFMQIIDAARFVP